MPVSNSKEAPWADLTDVIEMPRGMTEEEVYRLLTTGEVPADPRGPTEPEDESPELADAEVVLGEGDALALLAGIPVGGFVAAASDDDGWRKQLRAPRGTPIGGQWVESLGGVIRWITAPGEKKTRGATIYKKHEPGEVVAARGDGGAIMRVTPDGARYEVQARSDGDWKREATLTKKQAYDRVRGDEDWREPNTRPFSEDDDENEGLVESRQVEEAPEISETTSKDVTGKNQVDVMDSVDRNSVLAEIEGDGDRQSYMRSAVSEDVGDSGANYVARDAMGRLTGALAVRDYSRDDAEELGLPEPVPYSYVEFVGATEGSGAGTDLVRHVVRHALDTGSDALLIQATPESEPFWTEKMGFIEDPLGIGAELYGVARADMPDWLEEHSSTPASDEMPPAPNAPDEATSEPEKLTTDRTPIVPTKAVFRKNIADGEVIAENEAGVRVRWDESRKRFVFENRDGGETDALNKNQTYQRLKQGGWFEPTGEVSEPEVPLEITPEVPVLAVPTSSLPSLVENSELPEALETPQAVEELPEVITPVYEGPRFELPEHVAEQRELLDELRGLLRTTTQETRPDLVGPARSGRIYEISNELDLHSSPTLSRLAQEAQIDDELFLFRERVGSLSMSDDNVHEDLARRTQQAFANKKIAVRTTPGNLEKILTDGRFKSQFESGSTKGLKNIDFRAAVEGAWFGLPSPSKWDTVKDFGDPTVRPIYGYVALDGVRPAGIGTGELGGISTDALSQYGQIQVVLKDDVRRRTTAMFGDSLNNRHQGMPSPVDDPDWKSFTPVGTPAPVNPGMRELDRDPFDRDFRANVYAEAQVHGGVTLNDVEEVVFPTTPPKKIRDLLDEKGVSWRVINLKTVATEGSLDERANALRIAEQDLAWIDEEIVRTENSANEHRGPDGKIKPGYEFYEKDLKKLKTQRKNVAGALPALRDAVESDRQSEPQAAQAVPTVGEPEAPTTPEVTKSAPSLRDAYDAGFEVEREFGLGATAQSVELLRLSDGSRAVRKNLRDYTEPAEVQARSEYLAGKVANALGIDDVVTEQLSDYQVLTTFVDGDTGGHAAVARQKEAGGTMIDSVTAIQENAVRRPGGREIGLLDWLITNYDRHNGNYILTTDGRVRPIDHGNAGFRPDTTVPDPKDASKQVPLHTLISPFVDYWIRPRVTEKGPNAQRLRGLNPRFTKSELADVRQRLETIREFFDRPGESEWYGSLLDRLAVLEAGLK